MADKPKRIIPDTCRLTLSIRDVDYRVSPIARPMGRAWRLKRADGQGVCVVAEGLDGPMYSCADSQFRHSSPGPGACEHVRACLAMRLIRDPV